jgi:hypothetical protein
MLHHAADQLHVEMAHIEHAAARLAHHSEGFDEHLVENFLQGFVLLFLNLLGVVRIVLRFGPGLSRGAAGEPTEPLLNALPEFIRPGAQLVVGELLHLRLKGIDGPDLGHHALDDPLVFGPKDLANQSVNQTVKSFGGRELP